jgi:glycosyltransferase involved in cell wall biosynthesis
MQPVEIDTSILVTTFRRPRHLELVLESIAGQQGVPRDFEVVVSDDGSDDGTAELVAAFATRADFPVRFTTQPHAGFRLARVRNNAARLAHGRYLLFLDGDCVLPSHHLAAHRHRRRPGLALLGYCARLSEAVSRPLLEHGLTQGNRGRGNLAGLVTPDEARLLAHRHRRARWHGLVRHPTKPRLAGGDFGAWRADFERINGFDERFEGWGQEDDDLGLRLRAAGVQLASILDATCSLHVWHPTDPTATRRWRDGVNVGYFQRRGRLTVCRQGLVRRDRGAVLWGLPRDLAASPLGRLVLEQLAGCPHASPGGACEIEVAVAPTADRFTWRAESRLLVAAEGMIWPRSLLTAADRQVVIESTAGGEAKVRLSAALAEAG